MVYNGVFYIDNVNGIIALALSVGSAIPADYAFMAVSSYYLIKKRDIGLSHLKRSLLLILQVIVLYIIKVVTLRSLFGYNNSDYFVDSLLMKGAWWYIYPYILLTIVYPLINIILEKCKPIYVYIITILLGASLLVFSVRNNPNFVEDLIAFLFTYFFFGSLDKKKEAKKSQNNKTLIISLILAVICEAVLIIVTFSARFDGIDLSSLYLGEISNSTIVKYIIGRYNPIAIIMGYALFFLFRNIRLPENRVINRIAHITLYVFLLHDAILGVFWYFGKCDNYYGYYPTGQFILWMIIFVVVSFATCFVVNIIYDNTCRRLFVKLTDRVWKNVGRKT